MTRGILLCCGLCLAGCASAPEDVPPLPRAEVVDLERFMGDWYVIAHVPLSAEAEAYNAVERYRLCDDGRVATVFRYRDGGFEAEREVRRLTGYPQAESAGGEWRISPFWPLRLEYVVSWVEVDYKTTIIARSRRDYAWLMHRAPAMPDEALQAGLDRLVASGYARTDIRIVPQQWPELDGTAEPQPSSAPSCN